MYALDILKLFLVLCLSWIHWVSWNDKVGLRTGSNIVLFYMKRDMRNVFSATWIILAKAFAFHFENSVLIFSRISRRKIFCNFPSSSSLWSWLNIMVGEKLYAEWNSYELNIIETIPESAKYIIAVLVFNQINFQNDLLTVCFIKNTIFQSYIGISRSFLPLYEI